MGLVDCTSRRPNQKAEKVSAYDEEFLLAKLDLISASASSLNIKSIQYAPYLRNLLNLHDPAPQLTNKSEPAINSLRTISTFDTRLHAHELYLYLASQERIEIPFTIQIILNIYTPRRCSYQLHYTR